MERKRSDGTDGGYRWEGYMSRWTVNPIPEDRGGIRLQNIGDNQFNSGVRGGQKDAGRLGGK